MISLFKFILFILFFVLIVLEFFFYKIQVKIFKNKNNKTLAAFKSSNFNFLKNIPRIFIPPCIAGIIVLNDNKNLFEIIDIFFFISIFSFLLSLCLIFIYKISFIKIIKIKYKLTLFNLSLCASILLYLPFMINIFALIFEKYSIIILQLYPLFHAIPTIYLGFFYNIKLAKLNDMAKSKNLVNDFLFLKIQSLLFAQLFFIAIVICLKY